LCECGSIDQGRLRLKSVSFPCSGDLFVGRKHAKDHGFGLPMLGHYIVTSVVRQLIRDYRINTKHAKVKYQDTTDFHKQCSTHYLNDTIYVISRGYKPWFVSALSLQTFLTQNDLLVRATLVHGLVTVRCFSFHYDRFCLVVRQPAG
jgi:hypothetical protein